MDYSSDANQVTNKWVENDPIKLSRRYLQERNFQKAAKVLSSFSADLESKYLLAYTLIQMSQNEQASRLLSEIIKEEPLFKKEMYLLVSRAY